MQFNLEALRYTIETSQNDLLHYLKFNVSDVLKCSRTHDVWHVCILFYFKEHCFLYLFVPFRLLILSMLFFHLLVTLHQIFQQKRLLPNQAFVISLCNLILFLAVHFSLLKLLIYKFLFVKTLHIKMTQKLNVNQPLCMQFTGTCM